MHSFRDETTTIITKQGSALKNINSSFPQWLYAVEIYDAAINKLLANKSNTKRRKDSNGVPAQHVWRCIGYCVLLKESEKDKSVSYIKRKPPEKRKMRTFLPTLSCRVAEVGWPKEPSAVNGLEYQHLGQLVTWKTEQFHTHTQRLYLICLVCRKTRLCYRYVWIYIRISFYRRAWALWEFFEKYETICTHEINKLVWI